MFGKSCSSMKTTGGIGSTGFTSMSNPNNDRRIKAPGTFDSCLAWWMLTAKCALWPRPQG